MFLITSTQFERQLTVPHILNSSSYRCIIAGTPLNKTDNCSIFHALRSTVTVLHGTSRHVFRL